MDDARDGVGHNGTEFVSEVEAPAGSTAKGAPPLNKEAVNSVLYSEVCQCRDQSLDTHADTPRLVSASS